MTNTFNLLKYHLEKVSELKYAADTANREFRKNLPAMLRQARNELGLTQREIADKLGVDFSYISKLENGHVVMGQPTINKLLSLLQKQENERED